MRTFLSFWVPLLLLLVIGFFFSILSRYKILSFSSLFVVFGFVYVLWSPAMELLERYLLMPLHVLIDSSADDHACRFTDLSFSTLVQSLLFLCAILYLGYEFLVEKFQSKQEKLAKELILKEGMEYMDKQWKAYETSHPILPFLSFSTFRNILFLLFLLYPILLLQMTKQMKVQRQKLHEPITSDDMIAKVDSFLKLQCIFATLFFLVCLSAMVLMGFLVRYLQVQYLSCWIVVIAISILVVVGSFWGFWFCFRMITGTGDHHSAMSLQVYLITVTYVLGVVLLFMYTLVLFFNFRKFTIQITQVILFSPDLMHALNDFYMEEILSHLGPEGIIAHFINHIVDDNKTKTSDSDVESVIKEHIKQDLERQSPILAEIASVSVPFISSLGEQGKKNPIPLKNNKDNFLNAFEDNVLRFIEMETTTTPLSEYTTLIQQQLNRYEDVSDPTTGQQFGQTLLWNILEMISSDWYISKLDNTEKGRRVVGLSPPSSSFSSPRASSRTSGLNLGQRQPPPSAAKISSGRSAATTPATLLPQLKEYVEDIVRTLQCTDYKTRISCGFVKDTASHLSVILHQIPFKKKKWILKNIGSKVEYIMDTYPIDVSSMRTVQDYWKWFRNLHFLFLLILRMLQPTSETTKSIIAHFELLRNNSIKQTFVDPVHDKVMTQVNIQQTRCWVLFGCILVLFVLGWFITRTTQGTHSSLVTVSVPPGRCQQEINKQKDKLITLVFQGLTVFIVMLNVVLIIPPSSYDDGKNPESTTDPHNTTGSPEQHQNN